MSPVYFSFFYRGFETISAQWQLGVFGLYSGKITRPTFPHWSGRWVRDWKRRRRDSPTAPHFFWRRCWLD